MLFELVTVAVGVGTLAAFAELWLTQRRFLRINAYLEQGDPHRFLYEIEQEMKRHHNPAVSALLHMNQAAGLVYLGDFQKGLEALNQINLRVLNHWRGRSRRQVESLYYNNRLYILLLNRRFDEAVALWEEAAAHLVPRTGSRNLDLCLRGTAATYHYFCGDLNQARGLLEELIQVDMLNIYKAHRLYFLGRIDLHEGRFAEGMQRIEQAARLAPNGYLAEEPKRLSIREERVGAPGSGRAVI